jgi:SM-20-related protein
MDSSIFENIAGRGWTFVDHWLNLKECEQLKIWATAHLPQFAEAGIGKKAELNTSIRSDLTLWLSGLESPEITNVFKKLNELKTELNRQLQLPIQHFESHLAFYPPKSRYEAHVDQSPTSRGQRLISFVLYLNSDWKPADGGELIISTQPSFHIEPVAGRLVLFRSTDILHAVAETNKERWSITGWFRRDSF